nr:reticulon-like protein B21 [Tanacetum cinerariifolium]
MNLIQKEFITPLLLLKPTSVNKKIPPAEVGCGSGGDQGGLCVVSDGHASPSGGRIWHHQKVKINDIDVWWRLKVMVVGVRYKNESMDLERKRVAANTSKNGVVVGSVWESRMRGSFNVFNANNNQQSENSTEQNNPSGQMGELGQNDKEKVVLRSKQTTEVISSVGKRKTWKADTNPDAKIRSELNKDLINGSNDAKKSSPIQIKNKRLGWNKDQSVSNERTIKTRALSRKTSAGSDLSQGNEKVEKLKPLLKLVSVSDESNIGIEDAEDGNVDDDVMKKDGFEDGEKVDGLDDVCDDKLMTVDLGKVKDEDNEEAGNEEVNDERAIVVVKEMERISKTNKSKLPEVVIEEKKNHQRNERSSPLTRSIRKQPHPVVNHPRVISRSNELPSQRVRRSQNKLQNFIDLIMWNDASKSALIFGLGTFSIISSSYTQDLNISFISVISYMGLIYLAAIFIFKSFILRTVVEDGDTIDNDDYVVGEDEAIWALKLFLPYINEFLLKVKALFSGDPATTMKLAVLLFILARSGSSITIWKMAKLGFFGVFTVPKICSSYSSQLSGYGAFWVQRFKDAWNSCSQKKAVAFGIFTLVWNFSSVVARIWAVFVLLVAFKYYQQSMMKDEVVEEEQQEEVEEPIIRTKRSSWQEQRNGKNFTSNGSTKLKKRS